MCGFFNGILMEAATVYYRKYPDSIYFSFPVSAASSGTGKGDFERLSEILKAVTGVNFICLDVANGYSQHFVEYLRKVRAAFPTHTIIVSTVF